MKRLGIYEGAAVVVGVVLTLLVMAVVMPYKIPGFMQVMALGAEGSRFRSGPELHDSGEERIFALGAATLLTHLIVAKISRKRIVAETKAFRVLMGAVMYGYANVILFSALSVTLYGVCDWVDTSPTLTDLAFSASSLVIYAVCGLIYGAILALLLTPLLLPLGLSARWLMRIADQYDFRSFQRSLNA